MQIKVYNFFEKEIYSSTSIKQPTLIKLFYGNQNNFSDDLRIFYPFLSDKEIERSNRFRYIRDERTYVISHALVNQKISEQIGNDFNRIKINYFENKKPYIAGRPFDFNLSHSSGYFAFVLSGHENHFVGVDIEAVNTKTDIEPIVNRYFHKNEIAYVLKNDLRTNMQRIRFYEIWTRKEAFLKMHGTGLSEKLSELDMTPGEREITFHNHKSFDDHYFFCTYVYTLILSGNLVFSLSTNCPVNIIPVRCNSI